MPPGGKRPETVGVRELENQASRVIRRVSEQRVEYVVTVRGEPVALLRPLTQVEAQRLHQNGRRPVLDPPVKIRYNRIE